MSLPSLRLPVAGVAALLALAVAGCTAPEPTSTASSSPAPAPPATTGSPSTRPTSSPASETSTATSSALTPRRQARLDARLRDAAWADNVVRARRLVRRGASVNAVDDTQQSAYLIATSEGHLELLELTLDNGARVNAKDSFDGTGLIRAAERGHPLVVGRLLRAGIDKDHVNNLGWTALHEAVHLGDGSQRYLDTVRVLVAGGVDVSVASPRDGATPLAYARARGFDDLARLLEAAAAQDRRPIDRAVAEWRLRTAARSGDGDAATLALRAGARLEVRDSDGHTPLSLAADADAEALALLLTALGAPPA